ncbi:hypothetical protein ACNQF7_10160 [Flavobacterium sp. RSP29]|uniref:hypothetical protein n=1 Tax=Flavobacterium sp. RSP29 TaxID=3401731 RepID=UPI003AAF7733
MKNTILILAFLFSISSFSQAHIIFNELPKDATLILLDKQLLGEVEIDGHTFKNKTIRIKATIEGIVIYDSLKKYTYRKCSLDKCNITHLEEKNHLYGVLPLIKFTAN